jgi:hypothetical protein
MADSASPMPISLGIGEHVELPETKSGFRCSFAFEKAALVVFVKERRIHFEDGLSKYVSYWFTHSSVAAFFGVSRELARRIVERHLAFYDDALAETLMPVWAAWDEIPLGTPSSGPGPTPALPVRRVN